MILELRNPIVFGSVSVKIRRLLKIVKPRDFRITEFVTVSGVGYCVQRNTLFFSEFSEDAFDSFLTHVRKNVRHSLILEFIGIFTDIIP